MTKLETTPIRDKTMYTCDDASPYKHDAESEYKSVWDHRGPSWSAEPAPQEPDMAAQCAQADVEFDGARTAAPAAGRKRKAGSSSTSHLPLSSITAAASTTHATPITTKLAPAPALTKPKKKRRRRNRRVKGCNCKKSRCLKLYCECYAKQIFCGPDCNCKDCHNIDAPEFEEARANAVQSSLDRNTSAFFRAPIAPLAGLQRKGCKCKKSQCAKNYCECFQAGLGCMETCRCENCQNEHGLKPAPTRRHRRGLLRRPAAPTPQQVQNIKPSPRSWPSSLSPENLCPVVPVPEHMSRVRPDYASRSWVKLEPKEEESHGSVQQQQSPMLPPAHEQYSRDRTHETHHEQEQGRARQSHDEAYEQFMQQQKLMARLQYLQKQQRALKSGKASRQGIHASLSMNSLPSSLDQSQDASSPNEPDNDYLVPPELPSADAYDQDSIMYQLSTTVTSNESSMYDAPALSDESSHCSDSDTDVEGTRSASSSATTSPTVPTTTTSSKMAPELPSIMIQAF